MIALLIVDEGLFIAYRMFYPFIIVIPVVTHSNAYGVVCHPNALLLVDVYVVNGVAVHGVVSVEVSEI